MSMLMKLRISQATFDDVVKENMEDLEMEGKEALLEAITQFESQGVDLSTIMKRIPGANDDESVYPIVKAFHDISSLCEGDRSTTKIDTNKICELLIFIQNEMKEKTIVPITSVKEGGEFIGIIKSDAVIAGANGAITVLLNLIEKGLKRIINEKTIVETFQTLCIMLQGNEDNKNHFQGFAGSASLILSTMIEYKDSESVVESGLLVIRQAAAESEPNMASFVDADALKIIVSIYKDNILKPVIVRAVNLAISALTTADDKKATGGSNAGKYAKALVEEHVVLELILQSLKQYQNDPLTASKVAMSISHLAVNDVICKEFAMEGGVDELLKVMHLHTSNKAMALNGSTALIVVGRNDKNKDLIASASNLLVNLLSAHIDEPLIVAQVLGAVAGCTLRKPDNVDLLIESGILHPIAIVMRKHTDSWKVQRWCCIALRNLVSRDQNKEHVNSVIEEGVVAFATAAYHKFNGPCGDVAFALLRDLGADLTGMTVGATLVHLGVGGEHITGK